MLQIRPLSLPVLGPLILIALALPLAKPDAKEQGHINQKNSPTSRLKLTSPIDCHPGLTCFIQSYVDMKAGKGTSDPACGHASYDGHKGTDFRLLSAAAIKKNVPVRAAAPGIIKGTRDGMPDILLRDMASNKQAKATIRKRECGNGVVIDHGNGWETQYCHMRRGSLQVKTGQIVERGEQLGYVGYSGAADFAHLHLSLRHNGQVIDPFTGRPPSHTCSKSRQHFPKFEHQNGLWSPGAVDGFSYKTGIIIDSGFAANKINKNNLERGPKPAPPNAFSPALVFYARFINVEKADQISIQITGPGGFHVQGKMKPLTRNRATQMILVGKKRRSERWQSGLYQARVELIRNGKPHSHQQKKLEIK